MVILKSQVTAGTLHLLLSVVHPVQCNYRIGSPVFKKIPGVSSFLLQNAKSFLKAHLFNQICIFLQILERIVCYYVFVQHFIDPLLEIVVWRAAHK